MKLLSILFLSLIYFPIQAQFTGGSGGGSAKAQIRTKTVLSVENEQEKIFFENVKIITQPNSILVEWNEKIKLEEIEIIDGTGRTIKKIMMNPSQQKISIPFKEARGIYLLRLNTPQGKTFGRKIMF